MFRLCWGFMGLALPQATRGRDNITNSTGYSSGMVRMTMWLNACVCVCVCVCVRVLHGVQLRHGAHDHVAERLHVCVCMCVCVCFKGYSSGTVRMTMWLNACVCEIGRAHV